MEYGYIRIVNIVCHTALRDPLIYLKGCFWHLLDKKFSKNYSRTYVCCACVSRKLNEISFSYAV